MPPVKMRGDGRKAKNPRKTLLRLLSYMKPYLPTLGVVLLCIIANAVAQTAGSRSLGTLVDSYILPMVRDGSTDFSSLWGYLSKLACIFAVGMISSFLFMFLMVKVSQGTQKHIRDEMFAHMQTLPLRYFDTNTAGNIMSRYTSDIDTLRQMISQSIPQCASSLVTIVVVFVGMLQTSWVLTIVMLFTVTGIVFVTMKVAGKSAKYFVGQQQSLGALNGYVEEMVNGQKVVKVFTHEEACKEQFDKLNEELCRNARIAGTLSNMMGPINNNLGYVQYAILAIVGGALCVLSGGNMLSLGSLMSFMLLSRSFNMPISQVSNQINAIVMALAGAERIFELMDEKPETDDGYVQLVNAKIDENGSITETPEHTGHWAWKHPHKADGTVTYTELKGDITMTNVDFGYVPEKLVLHDVTLYAKPGQKIAFVGEDEIAKTTLFKIVMGEMEPDEGTYKWGTTITTSYFPLDNSAFFNDCDLNLVDWLAQFTPKIPEANTESFKRAFLGRMLFSGDDVFKPVKVLSGGEKVRCMLSRMMLYGSNVLVLDQPTNHLDLESITAVNNGLVDFKGVVLFASHDHEFVQTIANRIMVLEDGKLTDRLGTYEDYIASMAQA